MEFELLFTTLLTMGANIRRPSTINGSRCLFFTIEILFLRTEFDRMNFNAGKQTPDPQVTKQMINFYMLYVLLGTLS
jgi:hypothetical protein